MNMRSSNAVLLTTVALIVALLLAGYAGAYLWLSEVSDWTDQNGQLIRRERTYSQQWQAALFRPTAHVETRLRRVDVNVYGPHDWRNHGR